MITYINETKLTSITKPNYKVSFTFTNEDEVYLEFMGYDFSLGLLNPIKVPKFSSMIIETGSTKEIFDVSYNEDKIARLESLNTTITFYYKNIYLDKVIKNDIEYKIVRNNINNIKEIQAYQNSTLINKKLILYSNNLVIGFIESDTTRLFTFNDISLTKVSSFSGEYTYNY